MFQRFYPDEYRDSTYSIDFQKYYNKGYRGILFDVDNTLVPHNAPADQRSKKLFKELKAMGYDFCFMSNNKEPRVKAFCEAVGGTHYIYKANKPMVGCYERGMKMMGTNRCTTLFIGDQLFTDVYGGNRAKVYTILVKPMNPKEEIQIVLKRYLERIVLHFYKKRNLR